MLFLMTLHEQYYIMMILIISGVHNGTSCASLIVSQYLFQILHLDRLAEMS
jgi:hypothetical protein